MKRLLREPLLHFVLLGGLLYAAQPLWEQLRPPPGIHVSAVDQQRLQQQWLRETGRIPSDEEMRALLDQYIDEELLLREAHRLNLHERDPVVRQRLIRNLRFADLHTEANDDQLHQIALKLGMTQTDVVVRRRLLLLMRHRIESHVQVSEAEARQFFENNAEAFTQPARYSFEHIYFSQAQPSEIAAARHALTQGRSPVELGDLFLLGNHFRNKTDKEIERQLGADLAQLVATAEPGKWFGPVTTQYGQHLLRVHDSRPPEQDYAAVRPRLAARLYAQQESRAMREAVQRLRTRYRLTVENSAS